MKFDIPFFVYEMPTKEYWKSIYPDNGFKAKLAFLAAKKAYWRTILSERQNHRCCYCGIRINEARPGETNNKSDTSTVDHIIPKSKGGPDHPDNYVIACYSCNNARGDQDAFEFAKIMDNRQIKNCKGLRIQPNPPNQIKIALRHQLKELGVKVHNNTKPCKLQNKLETIKILQMIKDGLPNTFEPGTRAYKKYERYSNPDCQIHEKIAA